MRTTWYKCLVHRSTDGVHTEEYASASVLDLDAAAAGPASPNQAPPIAAYILSPLNCVRTGLTRAGVDRGRRNKWGFSQNSGGKRGTEGARRVMQLGTKIYIKETKNATRPLLLHL